MSNLVIKSKPTGGHLSTDQRVAISNFLTNEEGNTLVISIMPDKEIAGAIDILTIEVIGQTVTALEELIAQQIDHADTNAVMDLLSAISQWEGFTGKMQASARYYRDIAEQAAFEHMPDHVKDLSASERNKWRSTHSASANMMYERCERLNKSFDKRIDVLRTFVSYAKAEISKFQPNFKS